MASNEAATKLTDKKPKSSLIHGVPWLSRPAGEKAQVSYRRKCVRKRTD